MQAFSARKLTRQRQLGSRELRRLNWCAGAPIASPARQDRGRKTQKGMVENFPPSSDGGKARDKIGELVGVSGKSLHASSPVASSFPAIWLRFAANGRRRVPGRLGGQAAFMNGLVGTGRSWLGTSVTKYRSFHLADVIGHPSASPVTPVANPSP